MAKKRGLGRGLQALIPDRIEENDDERVTLLKLEQIDPRSEQPRQNFDEESLENLKDSIQKHGVIQPIIVCKNQERYDIIAGERRYRASKLAGLTEIPAIIRELEEQELSEISLIENIQREDLNPMEEAFAYEQIMKKYNLTQKELGETVGKSRSYIANILRLLKLDEVSKQYVIDGEITSSQARTLLSIKDLKTREKALHAFLNQETNIRKMEESVNRQKDKSDAKKDIYVDELENKIMESIGTKVSLKPKKRGKGGKIEISYFNEEDLMRILSILNVE